MYKINAKRDFGFKIIRTRALVASDKADSTSSASTTIKRKHGGTLKTIQ